MNALFLRDLADKTRRGLRGRVEAGSSGGGLSYGYDVVLSLDEKGKRRINQAEAAIILQIFRDYSDGLSPKAIALQLNKESIPAPRGGAWAPSTINGNRKRGTGILNNELYVGKLVWNRQRYSKDPDTGLRQARPNDAAAITSTAVPELRIVDDALWHAVRTRQDLASHRAGGNAGPSPDDTRACAFWSKQRPRYLFSGLIRCGVCGGGFSKISKDHFGCSTARNKGATACTHVQTVRQDRLEKRCPRWIAGADDGPGGLRSFRVRVHDRVEQNAGASGR